MSESRNDAALPTEAVDQQSVQPADPAEDTPARRRANRVEAADGTETSSSVRQVEELIKTVSQAVPEAAPPGMLTRLRNLVGSRRGDGESQDAAPDDPGDDISATLRQRYAVHVSEDLRTISLFENGSKSPSITLDARSISTPHNEGVVVADVVALAHDRGWQTLKVTGTPEFKDAVWLEASKVGLSVQHEPSPAVVAHFAKWEGDRPANKVQEVPTPRPEEGAARRGQEIAEAFRAKTAEERLADPRLRNAHLELMVGIRTAEKELGRNIADLPDVLQALTSTITQQLAEGRVFEAPFVKPDPHRPSPKPVQNPRIEADRIPPPRQ